MKKAIIIGGGFAGCTAAHFLKIRNFDVTLYEQSGVLGGGCRTFFYHGHPYTYGPHHFLVDVDQALPLDYLKEFLDLREHIHYNMTYVAGDRNFYTYPIHADEVQQMPDSEQIGRELSELPGAFEANNFDEFWKGTVGDTLYNKFINNYSKKMWKVEDNRELDEFTFSFKNKKEDSLKHGSKKCFDGKKTVWYPIASDGYNSYFDKCVIDCRVVFKKKLENFDIEQKKIRVDGDWQTADVIVSTISPDDLMNQRYGKLAYVGRDFLKLILPVKRITPPPYYFIHYANDELYTRVFEYKLLTRYESPHTLIIIETPSFNNRLYPYPIIAEIEKAKKYLAELPDGVFSIGRMGKYHYDNMDVIIKECFELFKNI